MADGEQSNIAVLNNLIDTCTDGQKGFASVAEAVTNPELKTLFRSYSQQRARFATELQAEVQRLGGDPEKAGTLAASLHRGWINLKSVLTGHDNHALIREAERGEDVAVNTYTDALKANLHSEVRTVAERQLVAIKEAQDRLRALAAVTSGLS
jgi:uncharacterized protein (TIGR02284 family)